MTIEEYSTLMGYQETCTMEEYTEANMTYMMAGNMDKQTFCREYKKISSSPLLRELAHAANSRDVAYRDKETKERQTAHALLRQGDNLRVEAVEAATMEEAVEAATMEEAVEAATMEEAVEAATMEEAADAIDTIAAKLIGRKDCIRWKLEKGFKLSETDNEYIKDNLK